MSFLDTNKLLLAATSSQLLSYLMHPLVDKIRVHLCFPRPSWYLAHCCSILMIPLATTRQISNELQLCTKHVLGFLVLAKMA